MLDRFGSAQGTKLLTYMLLSPWTKDRVKEEDFEFLFVLKIVLNHFVNEITYLLV